MALGWRVLAVLCTDANIIEDHLKAGQAVGQVTLRVAAADVSASFLNQPNETPALCIRLNEALGRWSWP